MQSYSDQIKIGCCGFPVRKEEYFKHFTIIEIQQTFYQIPEERFAVNWRSLAPANFEFTMKAWQLITHLPSSPTYRRTRISIPKNHQNNYGNFKPTDEVFLAYQQTEKIAEILQATLIIFQCPASFKPTPENINNMKQFFSTIERKQQVRFGWEPRGNWDDKIIKSLCEELGLIHIVDPFKNTSVTRDFRYWRLHGIGGYGYQYTGQDLHYLKQRIEEEPIPSSYIMFNNVFMFQDALRFKTMLENQ
ncbi:MAG: DUF72 domain-containing protein [bacterium]|nr:DUF72 domain-containing protein [bacterium]